MHRELSVQWPKPSVAYHCESRVGATRSTSNTSRAYLLHPEPDAHSTRPRPSLLQTLLKTLRLKALYSLTSKWHGSTVEEKKVAIYKSRKHAAIQCAIHILPVLAVITIVGINLLQFYIGGELSGVKGEDFEKLAALQFAAKLHELLMLASLGAIVFTAIRRELAFGDGVPFGAVFAGLAIDSISTLWSMEFWSVIFDAWSKTTTGRRRKWYLVALLLISVLLGASVGPSTANLMRPRLADWPAGGTSFWIDATADDLYPAELHETPEMEYCLLTLDDPSCPAGDYEVIARDFMSFWPTLKPMDNMLETVYVSGRHALRQMSFRDRSINNGSRGLWPNPFTTATVGPAAVADSLAYIAGLWAYAASNAGNKRNFRYRNDADFAVNTLQTVVMVYCEAVAFSNDSQSNVMFFANLESISPDSDGQYDWASLYYDTVDVSNSTTLSLSQQFVASTTSPGILWLDDDDLKSATGSTINAVVVPPQTIVNPPSYYCCSIDSRQGGVRLQTSRNVPKLVDGAPSLWDQTGTYNASWSRIYPSATWAKYVNPEIRQTNSTVENLTSPFIVLTGAAGMGESTPRSPPYQAGYIVESAIASLLANGIARRSYNMSLAGTLRGMVDPADLWSGGTWTEELMPQRSLGYGGKAFQISEEDRRHATELTVQATVNGYAYSWHGGTQIAAICTLLVYAVLASLHTIYSALTGWYSGCWDTAPEIAVLALNSESTQATKNTGAGIGAIRTFEESIHVVAKSDHLELVPSADRYTGHKIKEGAYYG